jgi:hypothetical protein
MSVITVGMEMLLRDLALWDNIYKCVCCYRCHGNGVKRFWALCDNIFNCVCLDFPGILDGLLPNVVTPASYWGGPRFKYWLLRLAVLNRDFCVFRQSLQANAGIFPKIMPQSLPSKTFPMYQNPSLILVFFFFDSLLLSPCTIQLWLAYRSVRTPALKD